MTRTRKVILIVYALAIALACLYVPWQSRSGDYGRRQSLGYAPLYWDRQRPYDVAFEARQRLQFTDFFRAGTKKDFQDWKDGNLDERIRERLRIDDTLARRALPQFSYMDQQGLRNKLESLERDRQAWWKWNSKHFKLEFARIDRDRLTLEFVGLTALFGAALLTTLGRKNER